ncbi:MAG: hypothetical protein PWP23_865 [Candidatus Sumerlaeota bacterium]|nr:hypothetical protein [Candidatus Sumerlaeota bacterium]
MRNPAHKVPNNHGVSGLLPTMRRACRRLLLGAAVLSGVLPVAGEPALFVADPAADALYRLDPADPAASPVLVSGRIPLLADRAAFLSSRELLFSIESNDVLFACDLDSLAFEEVASPPEGSALLALDAGPSPDQFTALYGFADGHLMLRIGSRKAKGPWTLKDIAAPVRRDPGGGAPHGADVLRLDGDRIVLCVDDSPGHELLVFPLADPSAFITIREDIDVRVTLMRHPEGGWIAWPGIGSGYPATTLFDAEGRGQREIPLADADAEMGWAELRAAAEFAPAEGAPEYGMAFSFVPVPGEGDLRWRLFHPVQGGVFWLDPDGHSLTREFVLDAGGGPAFEMIRDIATGSDGALYVLDGLLNPLRLVRVDPATGDRRVAALLPPEYTYDRVCAALDGSFLLPRVEQRPEAIAAAGTPMTRVVEYQVVDALRLTGDPAHPEIAPAWDFQKISRLADLDLDANGEVRVFVDAAEGLRVGILRDGTCWPTPSVQYSASEPMEFFEDEDGDASTSGYRGGVTYPLGAPANPKRLRVSLSSDRLGPGISTLDALFVTAPGGQTSFEIPVQDAFHDSYVWEGVGYWRETATLDLPAALSVSGMWNIEARGIRDPRVNLTLNIISEPAPHARFFDAASDGSLWLYETQPPALLRWDEASGSVERIPMHVEDAGLSLDDLNRPSHFLVDAASGTAWIALFDAPVVVQADLATGMASVLMPGRPEALDEAMLDFGQTSHLRLAAGDFQPTVRTAAWRFIGK